MLIAAAIYYRESKDADFINNIILAFTAIVVLWYTFETAAMKAEVAKQNKLQTRPILAVELSEKSNPILINHGKGPALNSSVAEFTVQTSFQIDSLLEGDQYEIFLPAFIPQDSSCEIKLFRINKVSGNKGTIPEPDIFYQLGMAITLTIRYEDIEKTSYTSHIQIQAGRLVPVSFANS
jgi:hypothetical protein